FEIDVLDREEPGQMAAHARAILDVDPLRLVDEDANQPALGGHLPIDQLVPHRGQRLLEQLTQIHRHSNAPKKNGLCPAHFYLLSLAIVTETGGDLKRFEGFPAGKRAGWLRDST